jgi:hypothetical protein
VGLIECTGELRAMLAIIDELTLPDQALKSP